MKFYPLTVKKVKPLTSISKSIDLQIPEELKAVFKWKPGQFVCLKFSINGEEVERDYSICNAPNNEYITLAIKKTKNPYISSYLNEHIKEGMHLQVSAPLGNFGIDSRPNEKRTLVAFSSGSGITPILSIIKDTLQKEKDVKFYLFYGNSEESDVMFKADLDLLRSKNPDNFFVHYFYSQQKVNDKFYEGQLDENKLKLIINQIVDWDEVDEVMICGPTSMIVTLANAVYKQGIPKINIHYELYEPVDKVFMDEEIVTSSIEEVEVTFTYEGETKSIQWLNNGTTLLDALLDMGIDAPYSCKGGVCGTCQCIKEGGDVILGENLVLTDEDIQNHKILTCVAYPKSNKLKINMDEL